ncbi:MAG: aminoacyl-tRNA deacylase [Rubrivivax sp.]|nr:aminoacyl-tRNA deacylase [Rubrivivax sp.]
MDKGKPSDRRGTGLAGPLAVPPGGRRPKAASGGRHVSETPATQWLRERGVEFTEHPYGYVDHGGTTESAKQLGVDEHQVVKTLVMQDDKAQPLIVLMHGDRQVSTKSLAREIGVKSVEPCKPEVAQRHSGYLVGGTSPFATRKAMPVFVQATVLELPRVFINGGRRGYLVGIAPAVLTAALGARAVSCAL